MLAGLALVAQLDRASDFESEGREFESLRARQSNQLVAQLLALTIFPKSPSGKTWGRCAALADLHRAAYLDITATLYRANCHCISGKWSDEDYDVLDGECDVGRIYRINAAPSGSSGASTSCSRTGRATATRPRARRRWRRSRPSTSSGSPNADGVGRHGQTGGRLAYRRGRSEAMVKCNPCVVRFLFMYQAAHWAA
jgi:hypothetical protein